MEEIKGFLEEYIANEDSFDRCVYKLDDLIYLFDIVKETSITDIMKIAYSIKKDCYINLVSHDERDTAEYDAYYESKMEEDRL